jgi:hypothetical protein
MPQFNNLNELNTWLSQQIAQSMNDVGEMVVEKVKEHIESDVYSFDPKVYQRTNELKESIVHSTPIVNGDTVEVSIYPDAQLIHPSPPNQHQSVISGDDYSPYVAITVEEGTSGKLFGEGYWTEPRPFMENTVAELEGSGLFADALKISLNKKGINTR